MKRVSPAVVNVWNRLNVPTRQAAFGSLTRCESVKYSTATRKNDRPDAWLSRRCLMEGIRHARRCPVPPSLAGTRCRAPQAKGGSVSPSRYCMTRYAVPSCSPTSYRGRCADARAGRSLALRESRALYTSPIPPAPMADCTSYGPSRAPAWRGKRTGLLGFSDVRSPDAPILHRRRSAGTRFLMANRSGVRAPTRASAGNGWHGSRPRSAERSAGSLAARRRSPQNHWSERGFKLPRRESVRTAAIEVSS